MRFGPPIARLVETVSEDPTVQDRVERKARLREQVAAAGPNAAAIFAADKLSKVREIRILAACDAASTDDPATRMKLEHYTATARCSSTSRATCRSSSCSRFELEALDALPPSPALRGT